MQKTNKNNNSERGMAFIPVLIAIAVFGLFILMFVIFFGGSGESSYGGDGSGDTEFAPDEGAIDFSGQVPSGCLIYHKNPLVASMLRNDPGFHPALEYHAKSVGYTANDFMAAFRIECDFKWNVVNSFGCGGMFQLCPVSAGAAGIQPRQLASLSPKNQLPYMVRYFRAFGCQFDKNKSVSTSYLCIFLPGKRKFPPSSYIWPRGVNPFHDVDDDQRIFRWEVDCNSDASFSIGAKDCGLTLPTCRQSKFYRRR